MTNEEFERIKQSIINNVSLGNITVSIGAKMLTDLVRDKREEDRKDRKDGKGTNTGNTESR